MVVERHKTFSALVGQRESRVPRFDWAGKELVPEFMLFDGGKPLRHDAQLHAACICMPACSCEHVKLYASLVASMSSAPSVCG